jgi:hypothetical protein
MTILRRFRAWSLIRALTKREKHRPRSPGVVLGFRPQWRRVQRYYDIASQSSANIEQKQDEWLTFFLHCWALRDHIINDHDIPPADRRACGRAAGRKGSALQTVHDLAIAAKHFTTYEPIDAQVEGDHDRDIVMSPTSPQDWAELDEDEWPFPEPITRTLNPQTVTPRAHPLVTYGDGSKKRRAQDLGEEAMAEWRAVLSTRRLI